MGKNIENSNIFKQVVKRICKINNIPPPQKPKFEVIDNLMVIRIKNHLKNGVDLDCLSDLPNNWTIRDKIQSTNLPLSKFGKTG